MKYEEARVWYLIRNSWHVCAVQATTRNPPNSELSDIVKYFVQQFTVLHQGLTETVEYIYAQRREKKTFPANQKKIRILQLEFAPQ